MAYGDLKVRNLIWNTGSGDNTVVLSTLATQSYVTTNFAPKSAPTFAGTINGVDLILSGNLTVSGTQTIINTNVLQVEDKHIEIGKVSTPSDTTADGGGIILKASSDRTFLWVNATDAWTSSEHIQVASGKTFIGDGSTLTALNATNLASGTVPTARLGSGTASSSNYLRGDGSWQTIDLSSKANLSGAMFTGDISLGDNNITNVGEISLDKIKPDNGANFTVNVGTDKTLQFSGSIGEIGDVAGFQATNDALSANTSFGIRATDIRLATGNAERFRVGSAGQFGVGGATYGSSGQVLTSGGASAAPSWAAVPAGGNTFTAVANGSIANNKAVKIDTDGKVSEIKTALSASRMGKTNGTQFNSSTDTRHSVTLYDPDANRVVTYWGNGTNSYMKNTTWSISSTTGAFSESNVGTGQVENTVQVDNDHSNDHSFDAIYDTNINKHLFVFTSNDNNSLYSKFGTYDSSAYRVEFSHGSSSWTQIGDFDAKYPDLHYDSTTDRYVCVFRKVSDGTPYYCVGNQSSGTISWGTPVQIENNAIENGNYVHVCSFGNGKVCILWKRSSGNVVKAALGDISTSSNTLSNLYSSTQITTDATTCHRICYNENDDNIIFFYRYDHDGNDYPYCKRLTRNSGNNGVDTTSGSNVIVQDSISAGHYAVVYSPVTKTVHILVRVGSDMHSTYVTNTSGVPTLLSTSSANDHDIKFMGEACAGPASLGSGETIYLGLYNETRNNRGDMWSMTGISSSTNLVGNDHYVGFADAAYTNGQTATIKTYGNHVDTLSGLTPGSKYYVQGDGTVGTSAATPTTRAGIAIGTTKLLIQEPTNWGG